MQEIKIISLFYAAIQSFFKIGQKVSSRGLYIREQKTETWSQDLWITKYHGRSFVKQGCQNTVIFPIQVKKKSEKELYRINMQHIKIISLFYSRLQSFMIFLQIPLSKSLSQSLYIEGCEENRNLKISIWLRRTKYYLRINVKRVSKQV